MRTLLSLILLSGCPGDSKQDTDTAGCEASFREKDVRADGDGTPACVRLDPVLDETVIEVAKCADYMCYGSEDVSSDGFYARTNAQVYCVTVDADDASLYRFTVVYCTPPPPDAYNVFDREAQ